MTVAVDTSVAIPLLVRSHHDHAAVVRWWGGQEVALAGHALAETYSVLTRLPGDARGPGAAIDAERQQEVAQRQASRIETHRTDATADRRDGRLHQPGAGGVLGAERKFELARMRAGKAQVDVLEFRLVAGAHVVDDEVAALEADLGEVAAVEAERPQTVEPAEEARKTLLKAGGLRVGLRPLRRSRSARTVTTPWARRLARGNGGPSAS